MTELVSKSLKLPSPDELKSLVEDVLGIDWDAIPEEEAELTDSRYFGGYAHQKLADDCSFVAVINPNGQHKQQYSYSIIQTKTVDVRPDATVLSSQTMGEAVKELYNRLSATYNKDMPPGVSRVVVWGEGVQILTLPRASSLGIAIAAFAASPKIKVLHVPSRSTPSRLMALHRQ